MMGNIEKYVPSGLGAKGRRNTLCLEKRKERKGVPDRRVGTAQAQRHANPLGGRRYKAEG